MKRWGVAAAGVLVVVLGTAATLHGTSALPASCRSDTVTTMIPEVVPSAYVDSPEDAADGYLDPALRIIEERQSADGQRRVVFRQYDGDELVDVVTVVDWGDGWHLDRVQTCA